MKTPIGIALAALLAVVNCRPTGTILIVW